MRLIEEHPERVGNLLKERVFDVANLIDALRRLADGETVVDPTIVAQVDRISTGTQVLPASNGGRRHPGRLQHAVQPRRSTSQLQPGICACRSDIGEQFESRTQDSP
jgi:hypothetical protein